MSSDMSSNVTPLCGQSWRHVAGMGGSYEQYRPGAWQPCTRPGHHACLSNYPLQVRTRTRRRAGALLCTAGEH